MKMQFCNVHGHNGRGSHAKIILCIPPPHSVWDSNAVKERMHIFDALDTLVFMENLCEKPF